MGSPLATVRHRLAHLMPRPFQSRRQRTITALEFSGEWLKLARVEVSAKGKRRLRRLVARPVVLPEEIPKTFVDLVKEGVGAADSILISIPRNLVTVRNLQLPTTDPRELNEMIGLQTAKQTPYSKEEIISDFQVVRRSPEGFTDVVLITTHRSVSNRCLKILDDCRLKAAGIRLSSHAVRSGWELLGGATKDSGGAGRSRGATGIRLVDRRARPGVGRRERRDRFDPAGGPHPGGPRAQGTSHYGHGDPQRLDPGGPHGARLPARLFQEAVSRAVGRGDRSDPAGGERRGGIEEAAEDHPRGRTARELLLGDPFRPSPEDRKSV